MITNFEFGQRIGCSESMASRIRAGKRRPSADKRDAIVREFGLDPLDVMEAYRDQETFGRFIRETVFAPLKDTANSGRSTA